MVTGAGVLALAAVHQSGGSLMITLLAIVGLASLAWALCVLEHMGSAEGGLFLMISIIAFVTAFNSLGERAPSGRPSPASPSPSTASRGG
jgi:hypothetical protein